MIPVVAKASSTVVNDSNRRSKYISFKMDLKSVGFCILLAIIVENADGRHLSGGGLSSITGRQGFTFPRSLDGIRSIRQSRFPPHRSRRLARYPDLGATSVSGPFRISSVQPRIGSDRVSSRSFGAFGDLNPFYRRSLGRLSTRINPRGSSGRRLRIPTQTMRSGRRTPITYYRSSHLRPRASSRERTISRDLTSQLRQRFGRTYGSGTRDDPIRIPATLPARSVGRPRGGRPQLRQGIRQPVQRRSRQQGRRVQVSRARQPSQTRSQEVLALFGFDQTSGGSSGPPVLSETIDRQVRVQRTPIKKSAVPKSGTASVSTKTSKTKITKTGKISDLIGGSKLEQLSTQQLEKIVKETAALYKETKSTKMQNKDIKQETSLQEGLKSTGGVISQSETKQISKHRKSLEVTKATSPVKTDTATGSSIKTSAKASVDAAIADADNVNINIDASTEATGNNIVKAPTDNSVSNDLTMSSATTATGAKTLISARSITESRPEKMALDPKGISVIAIEKAVTGEAVHSEKIIPMENVQPLETIVSAEIVPVTEFIAPGEIKSASVVVPIETASLVSKDIVPVTPDAEVLAPVEIVPASEIVVPIKTAPESEMGIPVEIAPVSEIAPEIAVTVESAPASEVVVPLESAPVSEIGNSIEIAPVSEIVVPVETVIASDTGILVKTSPASETFVQVESAPVSDVVPLESAPASEIGNSVEITRVSEIFVPVETAIASDTSILVETAPASETVVHVESAPASETVVHVESAPASELVVPVESAPASEIVVPVESAHVSENVVPLESAPASEIVVPVEITPVSEIVVPVEITPVSEIVVPVELASASEIFVPVESASVSEIGNSVEITPVSEIVVPVETAIASDIVVHLETPAPEIVVPVETVANSEALLISPGEKVAHTEPMHVVDAVEQIKVIHVDTVPQREVLSAEALSQSETLALKAETKTLSDAKIVSTGGATMSETEALDKNNNIVTTETHL